MTDLTNINIEKSLELLKTKKISSKELVEFYLEQIKLKKNLNAYISLNSDNVINLAKESDKRISSNNMRPLEGIPIAIKDLFCTENFQTTAASKILENFIPTYESTVTKNLWNAGAILLGKTNLDEFAMGSSNETSFYGPVINPVSSNNKNYVPGGSSGGSAAAVAANIALAATGTDTGGSIRQPSSYCGIVGLKPTYGRCSRWGIVAFASSLDQAGPMTKNVEDCALLLQAMSGYDHKDSTSVDTKVDNYTSKLTEKVKGLRIGIPKEYRVDNMPTEIDDLWKKGMSYLKDAGAIVKNISLPHTMYALPAYYIVAPAEASSNLAR